MKPTIRVDGDPARGLAFGFVLSVAFWLVLVAVAYLVTAR